MNKPVKKEDFANYLQFIPKKSSDFLVKKDTVLPNPETRFFEQGNDGRKYTIYPLDDIYAVVIILKCSKGSEKNVEINELKSNNTSEKSNIKNLLICNEDINFLLIVTDKVMVLGLFKDDGNFDQNRLLTSKNIDSIIWAYNLFKNFKNENK